MMMLFGIPWLPCVVAPTSPTCSLAHYQKDATNTRLLLIAAFVVEYTKFSPDTHTHTHTHSLSLSLSLSQIP